MVVKRLLFSVAYLITTDTWDENSQKEVAHDWFQAAKIIKKASETSEAWGTKSVWIRVGLIPFEGTIAKVFFFSVILREIKIRQ